MSTQAELSLLGPAIHAQALTMKTARMTAYKDINLDLAAGQAHALLAEHKAGKRELLLTLAGHMLASSGELTIGGLNAHSVKGLHTIKKLSGLGWFSHVNELEKVLRVRTCISAELGLMGKKSNRVATDAYLEQWGLLDVAEKNLEELDRMTYDLVGIALGMAGNPKLLVVQEIERDLTELQTLQLIDILYEISHSRGATVVCGMCDYGLASKFDSISCLTEAARAQRDAVLGQAAQTTPLGVA